MRGIEVSLRILKDVRRGKFASESIRRYGQKLAVPDRVLLSLLVYSSLRRYALWEDIAARFVRTSIKRLSPDVKDALVLGTAGILDLHHFSARVLVNGLVQAVKSGGNSGGARLVNAVLRKVSDEGGAILSEIKQSNRLEDRCLASGIPIWVGFKWKENMGSESLDSLLKLNRMKTYLSLRTSPGEDIDSIVRELNDSGYRSWPSPLLDQAIRLAGSAHPPDLPGFASGRITPQSESSMMVGKLVSQLWKSGHIIDMCMGRAVKLGQIAQDLPNVSLEGWELSSPRVKAAEIEIQRLGLGENISMIAGDSVLLEPKENPGLVFLDAPCSGSGTWNRHPESKWRVSPKTLEENSFIQKKLLDKALEMVSPGGTVVYATCSLFREENERVVEAVLEDHNDCRCEGMPLNNPHVRRGDPLGTYIWPDLPWLDGFFVSAIVKD